MLGEIALLIVGVILGAVLLAGGLVIVAFYALTKSGRPFGG